METHDILDATHQLEESGMERAEAESVIRTMQSMVAPLVTREATAAEFKTLREEMAAEFKAVREEMAAEFKAVREETAAEFKAVREEMAAEFKLVRTEMEALEHKLVAKVHELATAQTWRLVGAVFVINGMFFGLQQMFG